MFDIFTRRQHPSKATVFDIPTPDPFENPLVETNPTALRQWTTALPFANPGQLSEAVLTNLVRLNRFPGQVRKRDELMEIYHTPVQRLLHGSETRRGAAPVRSLRRVMLEMAYGYSHIANESLGGKSSKKNQERLSHAIFHAIKFYLLEYLYACDEFDCRISHTYREVSRMSTYAEERKIHLVPIVEEEHPGVERTIEQQFKRFLLLLLLDPCHLQDNEPRICFDHLDRLAGSAQIKPLSREIEPSGHYVIDRLGEVPPTLFEPDGMDGLAKPRFALFDLNPVSQQLHQQLRALERSAEQKPAAMHRLSSQEVANLLARMLKSWHVRPQRDSERHTTSGEVSIWSGLSNIHLYLTKDEQQAQSDNEERDEEITLSPVRSSGKSTRDPRQPQFIARRYNQSRSGMALHLNPGPNTPSLIGELLLVSLKSASAVSEWKIGIVKRALNRQEEALEIGLQFVHGRVVPITLQSTIQRTSSWTNGEEPDHPTQTCLYIDQGQYQRSSLIVPKHFFTIGQEYRVEEMVPTPAIVPLQLLESTVYFERYRIKPA